jgi:hypothetical protein
MIGKELLARLRRRHQAQELPPAVAESATVLGAAAQRLLADPVLRLVFEMLEDDCIERWKATPIGGAAAREEWYRLYVALREVEAKLRGFVADAQMLESERQRREDNPDWAA